MLAHYFPQFVLFVTLIFMCVNKKHCIILCAVSVIIEQANCSNTRSQLSYNHKV